ncbi:MAG: endonuclease/exonuclease/phosphatase family protein [Gemmataceae bacterium]|nr:endonuclease/exonuclease/phosphatase family protein [Gemmataceae bacterium]
MPGVLFWNLRIRTEEDRTQREAAVCERLTRLVQARAPELLVFCECATPEGELARALNAAGRGTYACPPSRSRRIRVWSRLAPGAILDRYNGRLTDRITIREVTFPHSLPILLVGVHLRDRQTVPTEEGRGLSTTEVAARVRQIERDCGHSRTLLVGDLNMNPYEAGVVGRTHCTR